MGTVLYVTAEVIRQVAILAQPFMPDSAGEAARSARRCRPTSAIFAALGERGTAARRARRCRRRRPVFPRYVEPEAGAASASRTRCSSTAIAISIFRTSPPSSTRVVARARAAGVGRMVTISTRVRQLRASCSRSPSASRTSSARSARIRTTRTRSSTSRPRTDRALRSIRRSWRSARPGSTITTTTARATRRRRASAPTSRRRARPACRWSSMRARPTTTWRASWRRRCGKGAFPAVLHCFTGGPELAAARARARPLHLVLRHPDLQELRRAARDRQRRAARPPPGRDRRALSRAGAVSRQAQRAGLRGRHAPRCWPRCAASRSTRSRARPRRTSSACSRKMPRRGGGRRMTPDASPSSAAARPAACRGSAPAGAPAIRTIRRTAAAAARCWSSAAGRGGVTRVLVDTAPGPARAAARRRRRRLDARALHARARRPHPRHRRSARRSFINMRRRIDVYADEPTSRAADDALRLLLRDAAGQRLSADPRRCTGSTPGEPLTIDGQGGPIDGAAVPAGPRRHPRRSASASATLAYSPRRQRPAGRRACAALRGPRRLDRRRAALHAASEPFQRRRGARLDRAAEAASARS